jgi:putative zinc finger/helix-turn-helix YgiT family protein
MNTHNLTCRACREGVLTETTKVRKFFPNKREVAVELLTAVCNHCGTEALLSEHLKVNRERLAARKSQYGEQLMGEQYIAFRKRYGLTQQQASKIFGKGVIAFSRYENETTYPDDTSRLLIEMAMERPEVLKALADKAGVAIPLWKERCEDEQRIKVRPYLVAAATHPVVAEEWKVEDPRKEGSTTLPAARRATKHLWSADDELVPDTLKAAAA